MTQQLNSAEKLKILELCLNNKEKACAIAQHFVSCLQLISVAEYAKLKNKAKRTVLYKAKDLPGVEIEGRKFLSL